MIPVTYRASFSYLLRHPWQLVLSLLGIVIGVAVIVAVDLANSSARKAFLMSMDAITGAATHQVIGEHAIAGPGIGEFVKTMTVFTQLTGQSFLSDGFFEHARVHSRCLIVMIVGTRILFHAG